MSPAQWNLIKGQCERSHHVMPGHSRSKDGVASLAYVPGIHAFLFFGQGVDGRAFARRRLSI